MQNAIVDAVVSYAAFRNDHRNAGASATLNSLPVSLQRGHDRHILRPQLRPMCGMAPRADLQLVQQQSPFTFGSSYQGPEKCVQ